MGLHVDLDSGCGLRLLCHARFSSQEAKYHMKFWVTLFSLACSCSVNGIQRSEIAEVLDTGVTAILLTIDFAAQRVYHLRENAKHVWVLRLY